jgi:hypothetical protein
MGYFVLDVIVQICLKIGPRGVHWFTNVLHIHFFIVNNFYIADNVIPFCFTIQGDLAWFLLMSGWYNIYFSVDNFMVRYSWDNLCSTKAWRVIRCNYVSMFVSLVGSSTICVSPLYFYKFVVNWWILSARCECVSFPIPAWKVEVSSYH